MRADWHTPLPVVGVRLSLWRAVALFRILTLAAGLYLIARWYRIYAHPGVAVGIGVAMALLTAAVCWLAVTGRAHRRSVVLADLAVTVALTIASLAAQTPYQQHGHMPTLTTIWAAGPVLEAGFLAGWLGGLAAAVLQFAAAVVVRDGYDGRTLSSGLILLVAGTVTGYVAAVAVRAEDELATAAAARAALTERERLARTIHDGVLQVLGLVHRDGLAAGGDWARLGAAAAEQEAALRGLITSAPAAATGRVDVGAELRALRSQRVTVSAPAEPVPLRSSAAAELVAAVNAALGNVTAHAGAGARAWVLLEHLGDRLCVTVRDDGYGIAEGRLSEAERDGRIGIARSIRGRLAELGGAATITSAPGHGTVVELTVPLP